MMLYEWEVCTELSQSELGAEVAHVCVNRMVDSSYD